MYFCMLDAFKILMAYTNTFFFKSNYEIMARCFNQIKVNNFISAHSEVLDRKKVGFASYRFSILQLIRKNNFYDLLHYSTDCRFFILYILYHRTMNTIPCSWNYEFAFFCYQAHFEFLTGRKERKPRLILQR